uniref:Uncharacterized protein n=1 Tax=Tanacetum cinerariifolium TaxID=118510 RepID=A0A6L2K096_TANCI|nr:hypothetical protein [Tanacetum cinerariifolium]
MGVSPNLRGIPEFNVPRSLPWRESIGRGENVSFDLVRCYLCPSSIEWGTSEGVSLRVTNSHIGNHRGDDFTPLETIRMFLGDLTMKVEAVMGGSSPTFGAGKGISVEKPGGRMSSLPLVMPKNSIEWGTSEGVSLRVTNSHIGNHRGDDFTPLETIRMFLDDVSVDEGNKEGCARTT